jgi:hypothetical protein
MEQSDLVMSNDRTRVSVSLPFLGVYVFWCFLHASNSTFTNTWKGFGLFIFFGICTFFYYLRYAKFLNSGILFFAGSFIIALFFYFFTWEPTLSQFYNEYEWFEAFDPIRIYIYSRELAANDFNTLDILWDFSGVFYIYGVLMALGNSDPLLIIFFHYLCLLVAVAHFARTLNNLALVNKKSLILFFFLSFLLPEVIYFMNLPSKDTLLIFLLTFYFSYLLRYFFLKRNFHNLIFIILIAIVASTLRGLLIPVTIICFLCFKYTADGFSMKKLIPLVVLGLLVFTLLLSAGLLDFIGSYINEKLSFTEGYEEGSLGKLFVTDSLLLSLIFIPVKVLFYILGPLADIPLIPSLPIHDNNFGMILMHTLTTIIYMFTFPMACVQIIESYRTRKTNRPSWAMSLSFLFLYILISNGTPIIHVRYRVMASIIMCAMIVIGRFSNRRLLGLAYILWTLVILIGIIVYLLYKNM